MKELPNLISATRLLLSPLVPFLSYSGKNKEASLLFLLLALSDAVDGFLARRLKAQTITGKFLDPLADKVLLLTGLISVTLFTHVRVSPDLPLLLLLRDLFLVVGSLILRRLGFVPEPSLFGKLTTLCVSLTVILAFSLNLYPIGSVVLLRRFETLSMILILVSWVEYSLRGASFLRSKLIMERR